jgi:hypothetical protein
MDVSRYDVIRYKDSEQFEYVMNENLPLGPTAERAFDTFTAYSKTSRTFVSVAATYPVPGVDSLWVHVVNDYANATSPVHTNILLGHPDASPDDPGTLSMARVLFGPNERLFAIFNDGSLHDIDVVNAKYSRIGSIYDSVEFQRPTTTFAHVVDGNILKSFIIDPEYNSYLVKTDLSTPTVTGGAPLKITYIRNMDFQMTPINALMTSSDPSMAPKLTLIVTGQFDQVQWVNEETGEVIDTVSNLMEYSSLFACYESTKDCDYWRTAAYDEDNHAIYIQAHQVDAAGTMSLAMLKIAWSPNKVTGIWYPYVNTAMWPMNFGYSGYQYVTIKQD